MEYREHHLVIAQTTNAPLASVPAHILVCLVRKRVRIFVDGLVLVDKLLLLLLFNLYFNYSISLILKFNLIQLYLIY